MENNKTVKIVFATGNPHKLQEINEISKDSGVEFILPPAGFNPIENGTTFEENSFIKAKEAARLSHCISLADDSGLCVEALMVNREYFLQDMILHLKNVLINF